MIDIWISVSVDRKSMKVLSMITEFWVRKNAELATSLIQLPLPLIFGTLVEDKLFITQICQLGGKILSVKKS